MYEKCRVWSLGRGGGCGTGKGKRKVVQGREGEKKREKVNIAGCYLVLISLYGLKVFGS